MYKHKICTNQEQKSTPAQLTPHLFSLLFLLMGDSLFQESGTGNFA